MVLSKRWRDLTRETVGAAPNRYGVYELGDADGRVLEVGCGVLPDELKDALAYGSGEQVRWEACQTEAEAKDLAADHRDRAGL